jgi:hypothetical protein
MVCYCLHTHLECEISFCWRCYVNHTPFPIVHKLNTEPIILFCSLRKINWERPAMSSSFLLVSIPFVILDIIVWTINLVIPFRNNLSLSSICFSDVCFSFCQHICCLHQPARTLLLNWRSFYDFVELNCHFFLTFQKLVAKKEGKDT